MKKTYLRPETECLEMRENLPLLEGTVTLPVADGGNTGNTGTSSEEEDVSEFEDLLSKPTTIYVAWDDDDLEV